MTKRPIFVFKIDGKTPETLSMKELSRYLQDLSEVIGHDDKIHFEKVASGSAELKWWPEESAESDVRVRIGQIQNYAEHEDIRVAVLNLNKRLANDNASAVLVDPQNHVVAKFPGKSFDAIIEVPAFWQDDRIQGRLIRIGGKDDSIHGQIEAEGKVITNITFDKPTAKEAVKHFLGPTLRFFGSARWKRDYLGNWKIVEFRVSRFDVLDDDNLPDTLKTISEYLSSGIGAADKIFGSRDDVEN